MSEMVGPHDSYEYLAEANLGEEKDLFIFKDEATMETTAYEVQHQPQLPKPLDDRL